MNNIEFKDVEQKLEELAARVAKIESIDDIPGKQKELAALQQQSADPSFWNDTKKPNEVSRQIDFLKNSIDTFRSLGKKIEDDRTWFDLCKEMQDEKELLALNASLQETEKQVAQKEGEIRLSEPNDKLNAILTIHAGAGGTESCDWAQMLFRMYQMYAEDAGFEVEVLDSQPGDEAGLKSVMFVVKGPYAYGYLKAERGVHRLVRISPFDAAKRRHTSFVSLDVVAEINDEVDIEIKEEDLRVDTYRSGGAGGQKVNKTDSAVRLTHLPTGIVVACQVERSQHQNKARAMQVLKAKLYELEMDKKRKEMERSYGDKGEIAWGSQIRSYVFQPYTMVKDHRTGHETANIQGMMDGRYVQDFIEAYLKQRAQEARQ